LLGAAFLDADQLEVLRSFKKLVEPAGLRAAARYVMVEYQRSERHACRLMGLARSTHRYQLLVCARIIRHGPVPLERRVIARAER
jgi:hypothetical protein